MPFLNFYFQLLSFYASHDLYIGQLCEIGNTVQRVAQSNGYRPMKIVTGHGVGVDFHMPPEIKVRKKI